MSSIGFVYILTNEYMDDVFKIGCTERSPHERAAELSKHTGVPHPFDVLCYIEVENFQQVERDFHDWLKHHRISPQREFFHHGIELAIRLMFWHPKRFTFCCPGQTEEITTNYEFEGESVSHLMQTKNPFETAPNASEKMASVDFTGSEL